MPNKRKDQDSSAVDTLVVEIVHRILETADQPSSMYQYIVQQLTEQLNTRVSALFLCDSDSSVHNHVLKAVYPVPEKNNLVTDDIQELCDCSHDLSEPVSYFKARRNDSVAPLIQKLGYENAFIIPLHVGGSQVGVIFLFDIGQQSELMELQVTLEKVANVIALVSRYSILYENLESKVQEHTRAFIQSERWFRALFDQSPIGMITFDYQGQIVEANPHFQDMLGYTSNELRYKRFQELLHPDDVILDMHYFLKDLKKRGAYTAEKRFIRKEGDVLWTELRLTDVHDIASDSNFLIALLEDITERKHAKEVIQQREEQLRLALEGAELGFWEWNLDTNRMTLDSICRRIFNFRDNLMSCSFDDYFYLVHNKDQPELRKALNFHFLGERDRFSVEYRIKSLQGDEKWVATDGRVIKKNHTGKPLIVSGIHRDITGQKRAEKKLLDYSEKLESMVKERTQELETKTKKLEESQETMQMLLNDVNESRRSLEQVNEELESTNEELKSFAYIVSHDLKAPLRAIGQLSYWLAEDYKSVIDEDGQEKFSLMIHRVHRMNKLIEGILQYSRIGRVKEHKRKVDLNQVVSDVWQDINAPDSIQFHTDDMPVVYADPTRMEQVFMNLIGNAVKYMDKTQGKINVKYVKKQEHLEFHIIDNGPGIEEKYHEQIFQIFQTLTPRDVVESTGVGLTLVKKIVENYNGQIRIKSEAGQGADFIIQFPLSFLDESKLEYDHAK
ncbi:MAG: PAS domain S-box protein [candidate division KSB1 bacterium]|nr:PAS domain S-box protein [candidate division KSB1 bacterium]